MRGGRFVAVGLVSTEHQAGARDEERERKGGGTRERERERERKNE